MVVIASVSARGVSKKRRLSQWFSSHGLNVMVVCLKSGGFTCPRGMERSSLSKSSSRAISNASSIHTQQMQPFSTVVDASFSTLSKPRKRMRCPVGTKQSSSGSRDAFQRCPTCKRSIAHRSCAKVLSRCVRPTCRTTKRFASGYFIICTIYHKAVVLDFLDALPPLTTR